MFFGEYDPDKAESWTQEMERTFKTMECAEEDQVRLVVYQLKGVAHEWWRVQRQTHFQGQQLDHITWQWFLEVFHGEYFPDYARRERRDMFHKLVQGNLTISQYHQRFVQLLRHVPYVAGSEQACVERFIAGLRPDLRWGVTAHMCTTLGEAVAKATALERETLQPQQQQQQGGASSRSSPYQRPAGSRGSTTSSSSGSGSFSSSRIRSKFKQLSTREGGRSRQQRRQSKFAEQSVQQGAKQSRQEAVCYTCGLSSHFWRDCPTGQWFLVLGVLMVRWCHPVHVGDVFVLLGVRRRWSFLGEGPNGSALLVEVRLLSSSRARAGRTRRGSSGGPRS
ncbi:hypothetical protein Taro_041780 [Colocasia esculenta]|uniref:CCHC-type domain-containing protein n=1 Tax=Colocasia esculenta TaxID=4460 RepID=A0A843WF90_COLES|nr:hypothetical protein [Colocasia esculenta]